MVAQTRLPSEGGLYSGGGVGILTDEIIQLDLALHRARKEALARLKTLSKSELVHMLYQIWGVISRTRWDEEFLATDIEKILKGEE